MKHSPQSVWGVRAVWWAGQERRVPTRREHGCCLNSTDSCNWTLCGARILLPGNFLTRSEKTDTSSAGFCGPREQLMAQWQPPPLWHLPALPVMVSAPRSLPPPLCGVLQEPREMVHPAGESDMEEMPCLWDKCPAAMKMSPGHDSLCHGQERGGLSVGQTTWGSVRTAGHARGGGRATNGPAGRAPAGVKEGGRGKMPSEFPLHAGLYSQS